MYLPDQYVVNSSQHTEAHRVGNTVTTTGRVSHCNFVLKLGVPYTNQHMDSSNQSRISLISVYVQHLGLSSSQAFVQKDVLPLISAELCGRPKVYFSFFSSVYFVSLWFSTELGFICCLPARLT